MGDDKRLLLVNHEDALSFAAAMLVVGGVMRRRYEEATKGSPVEGVNRKHTMLSGIDAQVMTNEERKARNLPHESTKAMLRRVRQRERAEAKRAKK